MTKAEAKARKANWAQALAEGRVVRMFGGQRLTSYPTVEAAQTALAKLLQAGVDDAEIVVVPSLPPL